MNKRQCSFDSVQVIGKSAKKHSQAYVQGQMVSPQGFQEYNQWQGHTTALGGSPHLLLIRALS